jgi:cholesterol transport system auxiliary component
MGSLLSPPPAETFDLTAPSEFGPPAAQRGALIVAEPAALRILDTDRIVVRVRENEVAHLGGSQWADRLPRLFQARVIQGFENARRLRMVGRPGEGIDATAVLQTEIRSFEIDAARGNVARVEITARLVSTRNGRVIAGEIFRAEIPGSTEQRAAAQALDRAMREVIVRIVAWTARGI